MLHYASVQLARALLLRILFGALSLFFISFVTFVADEIQPGDRATVEAGEKATPATVERIRENLGLNRPWPVRYAEYVGNALHGDFGKSYYGIKEPVATVVGRNFPVTVVIATSAITLASIIGIFLGTLASIWANRAGDRAILVGSTLFVTLPNFVLAPILVYIFCLQLNYLPQIWKPDRPEGYFWYLVLPVAVLAARPTALLTRLTRAKMVETMQMEFIRACVAKGVPPFRLVLRHGLRNAVLPVITAIGTSFGVLLTGSFVVETVFNLPGLGFLTIDAIRKGDMPVIQTCVLLTGAMFIFLNLIVDLMLPILDPRIRESQV